MIKKIDRNKYEVYCKDERGNLIKLLGGKGYINDKKIPTISFKPTEGYFTEKNAQIMDGVDELGYFLFPNDWTTWR